MTKTVVRLEKVEPRLRKLPLYVVKKLRRWAIVAERFGIREVRKNHGFHDEPLQGKRFGQRSARLNLSYRVIYTEHKNGDVEVLIVEEVSKHDY